MSRLANEVVGQQTQTVVVDSRRDWARQAAIVIGASLFVAVCAKVTVPLPFTPVPLTLQNFAVIAVGLTLGSRRGFAALALYLIEGTSGMPVFSPSITGGGIAQLLGPTGGFLMAYPVVAFVAGWIYEKSARSFAWATLASVAAEVVLFAGGLSWLAVLTHSVALAIRYGLYWFVFAEVIKIFMASGVVSSWNHRRSTQR
jgi:biotin transport system substrate-specific component